MSFWGLLGPAISLAAEWVGLKKKTALTPEQKEIQQARKEHAETANRINSDIDGRMRDNGSKNG